MKGWCVFLKKKEKRRVCVVTRERERVNQRWNGGTGTFLYERENEEFENRV